MFISRINSISGKAKLHAKLSFPLLLCISAVFLKWYIVKIDYTFSEEYSSQYHLLKLEYLIRNLRSVFLTEYISLLS